MASPLRIDSVNEINVIERTALSLDALAEATAINVASTQGLVADQPLIVGHPGREGAEMSAVDSIIDQTSTELVEGLKMGHTRSEPVTALLGDRIKIYRAPNVNGTVPASDAFAFLADRSIDVDQTSTYYRDPTGSSAYWYRFTYFNTGTLEETALLAMDAVRGEDADHYASLRDIRKEAGFEHAYNLPDSDVELQRRNAESEINAALSGAYTVPFVPVPAIIRTLTTQLAAALLLDLAYGRSTPSKKTIDARAAVQAYRTKDSVLTDDTGAPLGEGEISGYPVDVSRDAPRYFRMGDVY